MKTWITRLGLVICVAFCGCGSGGGSGSGSNNSGSTTDGGSSATASQDGGSGTTMQNCMENHNCDNGTCTCTDGPKKDTQCCDPDDPSCEGTPNACDTVCKYCM